MRTISRAELVNLLLGLKGATFITIYAETDARLRKTGNPVGPCLKRNVVNAQVNFHYDEAVLRQLAKEGKGPEEFERGESWHEPYKPEGRLTPLCVKKGEKEPGYLRVRHLLTVGEPEYVTADGVPVPVEAIKPFLPAVNQYKNQGVDSPIKFVTYGLANIRAITVQGEELLVA
jgi:hypothetical protein